MVFGAVEAHVDALDAALGQPPSMTFELAPLGSDALDPPTRPRPRSPSPPSGSPRVAPRARDRRRGHSRCRSRRQRTSRALRSASAEITPLLASIAASDAAVRGLPARSADGMTLTDA